MSMMRNSRPAVVTTLAVAAVFIVTGAIGVQSSFAKANDPATECLIDLQDANEVSLPSQYTCTDGDACDGDGATNGSCQIRIRACVNVPDPACTPQQLKKTKVAPRKAGITAPLPPDASSACGAFTETFVLKLRKKGAKASKPKRVKAKAKAVAKRTNDTDKSKVVCQPCPTESCVPTTTTTVTPTTTSTTTTTLACGNGVVDAGEACDPDAAPNGCSGGTPFCNATCDACQANCSQLAFTLGDPTEDCGFPGQGAGGQPPFTGELQDGTDTKVNGGDLGAGCLYIGGGLASIVPPGPTPDGSTTLFDVADCSVNNVTLAPNDTGDRTSCSTGPSATSKHCTNGHPGTDGNGTCATDDDCQPVCVDGQCIDGAPGLDGNGDCTQNSHCGVSSAGGSATLVCLPDPSCYFGNPLPINNTGTSTCVLNVIADGVTGTADIAAGSGSVTLPLKSWVYLTGVESDFSDGNACPICDNGVCNAGEREGLPCTTNSNLLTTLDCPPPDHLFLAPLDVTLGPLTTDVVNTQSDGNGIFCPSQPNGGAFGVDTVRRIIENGSPASGGFDPTPKATTLASVFCIPATNNLLIDSSANLPGPGAIGLNGTARLR